MDIIIHFFRSYPEMAIFLTLGIGFWIGSLKYKNFSLGTVTSVLLVGVLVGQMNIDIPGPLKSVFFLLFLFAIGYSVGPQFFQSLRSDGIHQVIFACFSAEIPRVPMVSVPTPMAADMVCAPANRPMVIPAL